jgi:hypothetical protein
MRLQNYRSVVSMHDSRRLTHQDSAELGVLDVLPANRTLQSVDVQRLSAEAESSLECGLPRGLASWLS